MGLEGILINFSNNGMLLSCKVAWLAAKYDWSINVYHQTINKLLTNIGLILGKVLLKCQLSVCDVLVE